MVVASCLVSFGDGVGSVEKAFESLAPIFPMSFLTPSQLRYLRYFEKAANHPTTAQKSALHLHKIKFNSIPNYKPGGGCEPLFSICQHGKEIYFSKKLKGRTGNKFVEFFCDDLLVSGDIQIIFYHRSLTTLMFSVCLNTQYEQLGEDNKFVFNKSQLDKAFKDKKHVPDDFLLELYFLHPHQIKSMLIEGEDIGLPFSVSDSVLPPATNFQKLLPSFRNTVRMSALCSGPATDGGLETFTRPQSKSVSVMSSDPSRVQVGSRSNRSTFFDEEGLHSNPSFASTSPQGSRSVLSPPKVRKGEMVDVNTLDELLLDIEKLQLGKNVSGSVSSTDGCGLPSPRKVDQDNEIKKNLDSFLEELFDDNSCEEECLDSLLAELTTATSGLPTKNGKKDSESVLGCWFCFNSVAKGECVKLGLAMECHLACLQCELCNKKLKSPETSDREFIVKDLKVVCINCDPDLFPTCFSCGEKVLKNPHKIGNYTWHPEHFNCVGCFTNLSSGIKFIPLNSGPMCTTCQKDTKTVPEDIKRNKGAEEVLSTIKDLDEGSYFRQYLVSKGTELLFDVVLAVESWKKLNSEKKPQTESLVRNKFSTASTLLPGVDLMTAPLKEVSEAALNELCVHHKEFTLSTTFLDYLMQIQAKPDEKDVEEALRRHLAEKFIPVVESELTTQELEIRGKVLQVTETIKAVRTEQKVVRCKSEPRPSARKPSVSKRHSASRVNKDLVKTPEAEAKEDLICGQCPLPIKMGDKFIKTKTGATIHSSCFFCQSCGGSCAQQTYMHKGGILMCGKCVKKLKRCFKCQLPVMHTSMMVGDNHYHAECLTCSVCQKPVETFYRIGDDFICPNCA
eukprot:TRINITY_DN11125_c0_g1_i1.p1 TRINITY_DN11125_c0_g1~~TRINITY_DN11125_c0_g1_i1.p1  ORF type:complete len:846 (-),score=170.32 TRINITY_DN11125_c0_g1_i1:30-2567(-)